MKGQIAQQASIWLRAFGTSQTPKSLDEIATLW